MPSLNIPQGKFLQMPEKYKAFVAGFGSGKTWVGSCGLMAHTFKHPRIDSGYFAPTYKLIKGVFYPTIDEVAYDHGFDARIKVSDHEVHLSRGRKHYGVIHCRTMDNPANIVGFKIGHALVDELDILTADKARDAWRKIIARMRYKVEGLKNGVDVTTTPEGFRFTYEQFKKDPTESYGLIQASTYDNATNLNDDYIASLVETYPQELISAYLHGQFVNLTSGTVYTNFDRKLSHSDEVENSTEPLYIGMDFNVGKMSAVVHVMREKLPVAVAEINDILDTPNMINVIKNRYAKSGRVIKIYPDASGNSRKTVNASDTDHSLLKQAGFIVKANNRNPSVRDRINSMQAMLENAKGERRYKINTDKCPKYTEALEQQAYDKNGEPDKQNDKDHPNDAGGYFISYEFPLTKPKIKRKELLI